MMSLMDKKIKMVNKRIKIRTSSSEEKCFSNAKQKHVMYYVRWWASGSFEFGSNECSIFMWWRVINRLNMLNSLLLVLVSSFKKKRTKKQQNIFPKVIVQVLDLRFVLPSLYRPFFIGLSVEALKFLLC